MTSPVWAYEFIHKYYNQPGSAITNRREPRSCLGRVFNCMLGSFTDNTKNVAACKWPLLKLKTLPRFCPVSSSLSMNQLKMLASHKHSYVFCLSVSKRKKIWEGASSHFTSLQMYFKFKLINFKPSLNIWHQPLRPERKQAQKCLKCFMNIFLG